MNDPESPFLTLSYTELEELNLGAKEKRKLSSSYTDKEVEKYYREYLEKESKIKAVTIGFSDLECRFHMLDYDKKYFLKTADKLTFDGSSVRGFSSVNESDLLLEIDWRSFYWLPADIFGAGKVLIFANIMQRDGAPHPSDFRTRLKSITTEFYNKNKQTVLIGPEVEGFLVEGRDAELNYDREDGFLLMSSGGYYHSLPTDPLKQFIDKSAEAQRAMGFENEKDHPEVAPSQFELNFSPSEASIAADQIQLYKLICRQVADKMGYTATFLPKPRPGINGSGMHTNISINYNGENLFLELKDENSFSKLGYQFVNNILDYAQDISLILNPSVNAYRRLDPKFEAPNQITYSPIDRSSMIRIPFSTGNSKRLEVRSVAPDVNPYLVIYTLLTLGIRKRSAKEEGKEKTNRLKTLPANIYDAIRIFKASDIVKDIMGAETARTYCKLKEMQAHRCPKELGKKVKRSEIVYHHEITNQSVWTRF